MNRSPLALLLVCACTAGRSTWPDEPTAGLLDRPAPVNQAPPGPTSRQSEAERPRNYFDIMLGASRWDGLGDLDPSGVAPVPGRFGDFDSWGFAFSMGYDRVVWSGEPGDWTLGLETGWSTFDNDGSGLASPYSDIFASFYYLTPVTRWRFPLSPAVTLIPGIGAGYYGLSIDEYDNYYGGWWYGYGSRTLNEDSAFGGFVSLGLDFHIDQGVVIRVDSKVHYVEFEGLQSLMPNETRVDGPIQTIEIGFAFAF